MKWSDLREDIGSRFVGDPTAFLVFVPLWWVLSMWAIPDTDVPEVFWASMLANALAFTACFGVLVIFRRTIFAERHIRTVPVALVLGAGLHWGR